MERASERRTWGPAGGFSSSLSEESLLSELSSGFTAPGSVVGVGLAWLGGTAVGLAALFLAGAAAAGGLFTGVALTCAAFTAGFAWEREEQEKQVTSYRFGGEETG